MQSESGPYSLPRWRITRWLADAGPTAPEDIRVALIGGLYGSLPVFAAGAINTVAVAGAIAIRQPTTLFVSWFIIELAICLARLTVLVIAHRAMHARREPVPGQRVGNSCAVRAHGRDRVRRMQRKFAGKRGLVEAAFVAAEQDCASSRLLESGDHPQHGGLARS